MGKQGKIKEEDQVRALHIECPTEQFQVVKAILLEIYSADAEAFPGGIKLRLVEKSGRSGEPVGANNARRPIA